jgi:hypothetical protein
MGRFKAGAFNHLQLAFLAVAQTKALCLRRRRQAGAELRSAGDLRRHPPPRRVGGDAQLYRNSHLGELQRACREPEIVDLAGADGVGGRLGTPRRQAARIT